MNIDAFKSDKTVATLALQGRLDTVNAPMLERKIKQWGDEITEIILDFSKLEYISSMGLRVLLHAKKTMNTENRKLTIINMNDSVREVFEMTGFLGLMVHEEKFVVIRKDESDSITLSFNGEMDTADTSAVSQELAKIKEQNYNKSVTVIFNMEKLISLSFGAVKHLSQAIADTAWNDRKLRIRNVCDDVLTSLKLEGLDALAEQ